MCPVCVQDRSIVWLFAVAADGDNLLTINEECHTKKKMQRKTKTNEFYQKKKTFSTFFDYQNFVTSSCKEKTKSANYWAKAHLVMTHLPILR